MSLKSSFIVGIIGALLLLATVSSTYFWYQERNKPTLSRTEYLPAPPMKPIIKKIPVPGPATIEVIDKTQLIKKIDMPEGFKNDPNQQALATAAIPPYNGTTSVVSVLRVKDGVGIGEILVKQEPLSFMGFENDKEIYAKAGYSTTKETQITVGGRWLFGRVGGIKIGLYGEGKAGFATDEAKTSGEAAAGIILTY